ncbi:MAG: glutamate formimidoyltransferase [candidate division KSB1 bacterium]|jgi:glutamate formiminotransferase/formiminotetrahydrofolate cyclodeaminase|nr:glutamate formimidoyltransferase [candidate division KSB1 bacterium]
MEILVECVPNFSEGRDRKIIDAIAKEITDTDNVKLLDVDPGSDTNRTVVTFIGTPDGVETAAFKAIKKAAELIDMQQHSGAHARMGATDVCPFVPVSGISVDECIDMANRLGERVAEELEIPVYLYEEAAKTPDRKNLADVRRGEYEGLPEKLKDPIWKPDFGEATFNSKSGATVIGVREFLIAYNINLNTRDRKLATDIALTIREKGRLKRDVNGVVLRDGSGKALRQPGLLKECKAVGWYIDEYEQAQISMNLVNYKVTPPHIAFDTVCSEAEKRGLRVTGSELVGLIPLSAILEAGKHYLRKQGKSTGVSEEELIHTAATSLGLKDVADFDPAKKIIEYQVRETKGPLVRKDMREFANELASESPAPGGGSVSALAGALASGLVSMVANLTHGKKEYSESWQEMEDIASRAQSLKDDLLRSIDQDTEAFNALMSCFGMPKKTDEQKALRNVAIQKATQNACEVPLSVMKMAIEVLKLSKIVAVKGNENALSDAGVSALMGLAAIKGAGYNVSINLGSIEDSDYVRDQRTAIKALKDKAEDLADSIEKEVSNRLEG